MINRKRSICLRNPKQINDIRGWIYCQNVWYSIYYTCKWTHSSFFFKASVSVSLLNEIWLVKLNDHFFFSSMTVIISFYAVQATTPWIESFLETGFMIFQYNIMEQNWYHCKIFTHFVFNYRICHFLHSNPCYYALVHLYL